MFTNMKMSLHIADIKYNLKTYSNENLKTDANISKVCIEFKFVHIHKFSEICSTLSKYSKETLECKTL